MCPRKMFLLSTATEAEFFPVSDLLYLHRSFFARALTDHPKDPLGSPYGTSVIAAYRSAGSLVALVRNLHAQLKEPSERIWFLWAHMFSCAVSAGNGFLGPCFICSN